MKSTFDLMRAWAALTGLVLALCYFGALYLGMRPGNMLPMLVTAIGGFELALYGQDLLLKRMRPHG